MQGIGRWRHRKAPTPRRSDDDIQLDIASLSISVEGRWSPCRSAAALTWSRHPDLNWGPADYEVAGDLVIKVGTPPRLKSAGLNLGSSFVRQRGEGWCRELSLGNAIGRLALTVTVGHRILPRARRLMRE